MHLVFFMPFFSVIYRHLQIGMSLLSEIPKTPQMLLSFPTSTRSIKGAKKKLLLIAHTDFMVMSEKVCKILLVLSPCLGNPSMGEICDVDISLPFYLIFHSPKYGSRLAYVPSVFSLATDPKR